MDEGEKKEVADHFPLWIKWISFAQNRFDMPYSPTFDLHDDLELQAEGPLPPLPSAISYSPLCICPGSKEPILKPSFGNSEAAFRLKFLHW